MPRKSVRKGAGGDEVVGWVCINSSLTCGTSTLHTYYLNIIDNRQLYAQNGGPNSRKIQYWRTVAHSLTKIIIVPNVYVFYKNGTEIRRIYRRRPTDRLTERPSGRSGGRAGE